MTDKPAEEHQPEGVVPTPCIPVDVRDDGLLWAINAALLHPRGFALGWDADNGFFLYGDGDEVYMYAEEVFEAIDERFKQFERLLERARVHNRKPS